MANDNKTGAQVGGKDLARQGRAEQERARRLREALRENLRKRKAVEPVSVEQEDRMLRRAEPLHRRGDAIKKPDRSDS
jgi:ribosomal protein S4